MGGSGNVEEDEQTFSEGSRVEVTSNEEGFTGAWYLATVLQTPSPPKKRSRSPTGNRRTSRTYLVEYENLLCDDDPSKPLCEYVDVSFIRPEQPPVADDGGNYGVSVGDVVDVNHRDGWWTGVVKGVVEVDGIGLKKYSVCFQNPPDEIECDGSDIRVHFDWVDRRWVRPEIQKSKDANLGTDRSLKTFKAGNAVEEQPPSQLEIKEQTVGKHGSGSANYKKKRRAEKRSHAGRFHASAKGDKGYKLGFNAGEGVEKWGGEVVEKEGVEEDVLFAEETGSEAQNLHQLPEKASLEFVPDQDPQARELDKIIMESDKSNEENHIRKKRGRTQELLGEIRKGSIEGEKHDIAAGALNQIAVKNVATSAVHIPSRLRRGILLSDSNDDFPSWILNKECRKLIADSKRFLSVGRHPNSRGKLGESNYEPFNFKVKQNRAGQSTMLLLEECQDKTTSVNSSPIQDPQNASKGQSSEVHKISDSDARDATDVINDELPSDIFDEEVLFTWYEGRKSTMVMNNEVSNGTALELLNESGVLDESNDRQTHTPMQMQSFSVVVNKSVEESQNLPFAKCSPVWKSIESLDVFQKTPQRPHFSPLVKCSEDSREGLAVGHMITFANLVERTLNLQVSDPQSLIERSLETVEELENHGFEVEAVRNRLMELQGLKAKVGELKDSSKEAEGEIMKLNVEKKEIEKLMDIVEMKMREIKEKLGEAASLKETKVKQIDVLQSKVNFFSDSLENAKRDFERVVASPL